MMLALTILAAVGAPATEPDRLPPEPPPQMRDLPSAATPPAIFTYTVDGECRITGTRKLQGPEQMSWETVERERDVFQETTEWRFIEGVRRQLRERRVKLRGEMVEEGDLVCHVLPSGDVVAAWIERREPGVGRRQAPRREALTVQDGGIERLGTFSLDVQAELPAP